jgi:hypothetical protein
MTIREMIESVSTLYAHRLDDPCAYDLWLPSDVHSAFDNLHHDEATLMPLTKDEVAGILDEFHHNRDADIGLNWLVLEEITWQTVLEREQKDGVMSALLDKAKEAHSGESGG